MAGLGFAALALASGPATAGDPIALLKGQWKTQEDLFTAPDLRSEILQVMATDRFLQSSVAEKKKALEGLAAAWDHALREAGQPRPRPLLIEVRWSYGGWLWRSEKGATGREKVAMVDRWEDQGLPWIYNASTRDRWFLFFGGQSVSGGDIGSSSGFNLRLGTTLFKERYDVAFLFNQTSTGPKPKTKATAYGAVGRMLFRRPNNWGYNLGLQASHLAAKGAKSDDVLSLVMGLNFYQAKGTWDASLALGDQGNRTLILGYSFFLTR